MVQSHNKGTSHDRMNQTKTTKSNNTNGKQKLNQRISKHIIKSLACKLTSSQLILHKSFPPPEEHEISNVVRLIQFHVSSIPNI